MAWVAALMVVSTSCHGWCAAGRGGGAAPGGSRGAGGSSRTYRAAPPDLGTRRRARGIGDLKLFEPAAIHLLVAGREGWWPAIRICQLLQRRRSL